MGRAIAHSIVAAMGQYGSLYVEDTTEHVGNYIAIQVLESTTFTTLDGNMENVSPSTVFVPGVYTGEFSRVQLGNGRVILYKGGGSI